MRLLGANFFNWAINRKPNNTTTIENRFNPPLNELRDLALRRGKTDASKQYTNLINKGYETLDAVVNAIRENKFRSTEIDLLYSTEGLHPFIELNAGVKKLEWLNRSIDHLIERSSVTPETLPFISASSKNVA